MVHVTDELAGEGAVPLPAPERRARRQRPPHAARSEPGWGGPGAVTVVPPTRDRRRRDRGGTTPRPRLVETHRLVPPAAFDDAVRLGPGRSRRNTAPPPDPPTLPLPIGLPLLRDLPTVPQTPLLQPRRPSCEPDPEHRGRNEPAPHPVAPPVRRTRRGRVVLLALVLGFVIVTVTGDVRPFGPPTRPPAADTPGRAPTGTPAPTGPTGREADPTAVARIATAEIDRLVQGESVGHVSVAALDVGTGRSFGYAADTPIYTASVIKLAILETLLLRSQDAGRQPTAEARELAARMIEQSDNDAATQLWDDLGGAPAVAAANRRLGTRATHLDGHWGSSTTSASDQLALLAGVSTSSLLDPAARSFAQDLMTHVVDDQRWGVSAAADPATTTALKNGWVPFDSDEGRWVVGSVGIVTAGGGPVLLAVLTEHQPSRVAGIRLVEALSRIAASAVVRACAHVEDDRFQGLASARHHEPVAAGAQDQRCQR